MSTKQNKILGTMACASNPSAQRCGQEGPCLVTGKTEPLPQKNKWGREMAKWVWTLQCKLKDLSLNPQTPTWKPGMATCACSSSVEKWRRGIPEVHWPAGKPKRKLWVWSEAILREWWWQPMFLSIFCMSVLGHRCTHTGTHMYTDIHAHIHTKEKSRLN